MRKSNYSVEQIIGILREASGASTVKEVCARHNVSEATFYKWFRKYDGMDVDEAKRLKAWEEENLRLKQAAADLTVQVQILQEVNVKKW
jgi:putative transposase